MAKIKILLVEDDKVDQMAFRRLVKEQSLPYDYTIAGSVIEAIQALSSQDFDIILLDYLLGDGTAFDILEPALEKGPVILITGAGDEETAVKAMKAGADDYLIKDLERNYLKVLPLTVSQILKHRADQRAVQQLRDTMIHTMVHDLRSPLGAIFTSLEFLTMDASHLLEPDHRQILEVATNSAKKMLRLINSILDVSRLESGQMPLNRTAVQLDELFAEMLHSQESLAKEKSISLETDAPSTLSAAWADAVLIERVLQNLVNNAIKFTPEGGRVQLSANLRKKDGRSVIWVSVQDSGPGIPPELQGRLFQKFTTGSQMERGSGLGLAFSKLVIEAHGEKIWIDNKPGKGATFVFSLPIYTDTDA